MMFGKGGMVFERFLLPIVLKRKFLKNQESKASEGVSPRMSENTLPPFHALLKYHILSSFLSLITRHSLLVILLIIACHLSLVTSAYAEPPKRIVSLAPSMTEILYSLGLGDNIVGVTNFCDHPEGAKSKTKIGGMANPSLEAVVRLKPDIVVMTTDGNPKEFEERLRSLDIKTYVFRARQISDLPDGVRDVGRILGANDKAESLAAEIEKALNKFKFSPQMSTSIHTIDGKGEASPGSRTAAPGLKRKKILFIVWPEPLIVAGPGTAINDAIALLGHKNIASEAKTPYPKYSIEEVIHQSPDVIFIGSGHINMQEVSKGLLKRTAAVPAVKKGSVYYVSDSLYRLGPRVIKGIKEMAECLK
ncbi:MAG: cobalamin-binding protein [Nitrospirota bacterium]